MKTITKSMITLLEIPRKFHSHELLKGRKTHTYVECHIGKKSSKEPDDEFTHWLRTTYPNLSRKISFLIHINV